MVVIMTTSVDSDVDTTNSRVIKQHDVTVMGLDGHRTLLPSLDLDGTDRSRCSSCLPDTGLPNITEHSVGVSDPNDMSQHGKLAGRPGRKYRVADANGHANVHGRRNQFEVSPDEGSLFTTHGKGSLKSEGRHYEQQSTSVTRASSSLSFSSANDNGLNPQPSVVPRSPRLPRRLPSLSRSGSQDSPDASPREDVSGRQGGNNAYEQTETMTDFNVDISWNPHATMPTSSSVFQKVLTDLSNRSESSMSSGKTSPGDLMVRRSSLKTSTGIVLPPALQEVDESLEIGEALSYLGMDLEMPNHGGENLDTDNAELVEKEEPSKPAPTKTSPRHELPVKTHSLPRRKLSKNKAPHFNHDCTDVKVAEKQGTAPRRHMKYPADGRDRTQLCLVDMVDEAAGLGSPNIFVSSPREGMLHEAASKVHKAQSTLKKWRSLDVPRSAVSTSSSDTSSNSPEGSSKKTRSISLVSPRYRAASPARSYHEHASSIDMKTAGQIARFITMAAASARAPGLNDRNQQLLPSDVVHLPNLDPSGRLLHRRRDRDEPMRIIKQAVNHNAEDNEDNEKSEVYSLDELRDCRYLRTRKGGKDSRRNSLFGFNEI